MPQKPLLTKNNFPFNLSLKNKAFNFSKVSLCFFEGFFKKSPSYHTDGDKQPGFRQKDSQSGREHRQADCN